jgi:CRP/FNR family cyclic AMP-dependent transcriptional regulator
MAIEPSRLAALTLFAPLTDRQRAYLTERTDEELVSAGRKLTHDDKAGYAFYVIEKGTADVHHDGSLLRSLGPGDFFGEIAILTGGRRTATVQATSEMSLVSVFGTVFRELEAASPEITELLATAVRERLAAG